MYAVLEPVTYLSLGLSAHSPDMDIQPYPVKEGRGTIQPDTWHTDVSAVGKPPQWIAVALQHLSDTLWWEC